MDKITCMNLTCGCTETDRWITGWPLKTGAFARLCFACGSAYESSRFCELFHKNDSGWRNCRICAKAIHCGCIASKHTYECLDLGGIWCNICQIRDSEQCARMKSMGGTHNGLSTIDSSPNSDIARNEGNIPISQDPDNHSSQTEKTSASSPIKQYALTSNEGTGRIVDSISINVGDTAPQTQRSNICSLTTSIVREENAQVVEQAKDSCNPRLLAKHMPKISNAELQLMFGALNATVTPLFEKVLSPSDVGRVNRLILPKVCAVTYFPYLTEPSGIPIDMLDSNGKNWTFQLRYWNNSNGRMYVFENVQGYIREMALEAQDTVIFGTIHPNKLVIGFKKSPRDVQTEFISNPEYIETTLEEAQYMLIPDPESECSYFMIDGYAFEAYDRPPIFGNIPESLAPVPGPSSTAVSAKKVKRT